MRPTAVVTGGGGGIGRATAVGLARRGYSVLVVGHGRETVVGTVAAVAEADGDAVALVGDVADPDTAARYVEEAARFGPIDALVNVAGWEGPVGPVHESDPGVFDRVVAVNLRGTYLAMRAVLPAMIERGAGRIVNVASAAGLRGAPGIAAYSAGKHGVIGLTRSAALEVATQGIAINAVCPGPTDTDLTARFERLLEAAGEDPKKLMSRMAIGRYTAPDEVAAAIVWLAVDSPPALTATVVSVDGGLTAD